ncbi:MAG TPA: hypothetical protein VGN56_01375 [Candidatus Paceibacterota bacterium]|jgi:hypothetical protein|nr:hypothetical protein [Candidatus Paceibacterota bacterium]
MHISSLLYASIFDKLLLLFLLMAIVGLLAAFIFALDNHPRLAKRSLVLVALGVIGFIGLPRPAFEFMQEPKLRPAIYRPPIDCRPHYNGCMKT